MTRLPPLKPVRTIQCPQCGGPVKAVLRSPTSQLNADQFDAVKAGDYCCLRCPDNGRGKAGLCYWWESELPTVEDFQI